MSDSGKIIGIGALAMELSEVQGKEDVSGCAAYTLHYEGDQLWEISCIF